MIMQIMINLHQILIRSIRPYNVSPLYQSKLFEPMKTGLWAKEVAEILLC